MRVVFVQNDGERPHTSNGLVEKSVIEACKRGNFGTPTFVSYTGLSRLDEQCRSTVYDSDVLIWNIDCMVQTNVFIYYLRANEAKKGCHPIVLVEFLANRSTQNRIDLDCLGPNVDVMWYTLTDSNLIVSLEKSVTGTNFMNETLINKFCIGQKPLSVALHEVLFRRSNSPAMSDLRTKRFLDDLRTARETKKGSELRKELKVFYNRLCDRILLSTDTVVSMLFAYRECEDFEAMISLVRNLSKMNNTRQLLDCSMCSYLYAFALSRRGKDGDVDVALDTIKKIPAESRNADMYGLIGRIHKDRFINTGCESALSSAIESYEMGYRCFPDTYLAVNLATLLVCRGEDTSTSSDLPDLCNYLMQECGRKGDVKHLTDYWDLATLCEVSVIQKYFALAVQLLERIYFSDPPTWQLKSTMGNIRLIDKAHKKRTARNEGSPQRTETRCFVEDDRDYVLFLFWTEFLAEGMNGIATQQNDDVDSSIQFLVLIQRDSSDMWEPAYMYLNTSEPKCLKIYFKFRGIQLFRPANSQSIEERIRLVTDGVEHSPEVTLKADEINGISLVDSHPRQAFLFTIYHMHNYTIRFAHECVRQQFKTLIHAHLSGEELPTNPAITVPKFVCNREELLGEGSFGKVYGAWDLTNNRQIAVKEMHLSDQRQKPEQILQEIGLHSRLVHKHIVRYLGAVVEDGVVQILMERVSGKSLEAALCMKDAKFSEIEIPAYSAQLLKGIAYLHRNRIVHRDIKPGNILIDVRIDCLKISDFGASKRLDGIVPLAATSRGTIQYMAPEIIDCNKGYDYSVDIWSFGCTVVQMLTGQVPHSNAREMSIVFHVVMSGTHPFIPDDASDLFRNFVSRCFIRDPEQRPGAGELLKDEFITQMAPTTPLAMAGDSTSGPSAPTRKALFTPSSKRFRLHDAQLSDLNGTNVADTDFSTNTRLSSVSCTPDAFLNVEHDARSKRDLRRVLYEMRSVILRSWWLKMSVDPDIIRNHMFAANRQSYEADLAHFFDGLLDHLQVGSGLDHVIEALTKRDHETLNFLRTALCNLWSVCEPILCHYVQNPITVIGWVDHIRDAVGIALDQINACLNPASHSTDILNDLYLHNTLDMGSEANDECLTVEKHSLHDHTCPMSRDYMYAHVEYDTGYHTFDDWLRTLGLDEKDRSILSKNFVTGSDFFSMITREDLYNIGLSIPGVLRVWRSVILVRSKYHP